jgi:hypothetical protein
MHEAAIVIEHVREISRRWRGTASERTTNIINITDDLTKHQSDWNFPSDSLKDLTESCNELQRLNSLCSGSMASSCDRRDRSSLLKALTSYCRKNLKSWACGQHEAGVMTSFEVHKLGFFLPGDLGGRRVRHEPTGELAVVKANALNGEFVHIALLRTLPNSGLLSSGWPQGVRQALIVILSADGSTEVVRQLTSCLRTTIALPKDSQGKAFIAKAAFLKHVNDWPMFGQRQTVFSMPLSTSDLSTLFEKEEEMASLRRENERLRRENEQLKMKE